MTGPLTGTKVLDLSQMYPGAFCTLLLADLGADVVKLERPGAGDGMRLLAPPGSFNAAHTSLNRGKRSVVVDLRAPAAADVLRPLVRWADLVVESSRPGQLDERGLGYDVMREENPAIVWCSVTGFGTVGTNAAAPGHDLTFLGSSGLLARLADGPPSPPDAVLSLPAAGSMAAVGMLAALVEAGRTGTGRQLEVSMFDAAAWTIAEDIATAANQPGPGWGALAGRQVYACADGEHVTVAATEPRSWAALCEAADAPDLADHRLGVDDEAPVIARLTELFATRDASDWLERPGLSGGVGPVHEPAEVLRDPTVVERDGLVELDSGARVLASPIRWDGPMGGASTLARSEPPALGEHTDDVLRAVGLGDAEITELRDDGVVG